jgi:sugar-specific transcriptional regulator TrmB
MEPAEADVVAALEQFGLTPEEALVYFALMQSGPPGTIVKDLDATLPIERTTFYSIIKRLARKGCVTAGDHAPRGKHARLFIATNPADFLHAAIDAKDRELQQLRDLQEQYEDVLLRFYHRSVSFSRDDVAPVALQYVDSLLDAQWRITSYEGKARASPLDYYRFIYHLFLEPPRHAFYPEVGVVLFVFDEPVQDDPLAFPFLLQTLKKRNREEILNAQIFTRSSGGKLLKFTDVEVTNTTHAIHGHPYLGFQYTFLLDPQVTRADLEATPLIDCVENLQVLPGGQIRLDYSKSAIIPDGNNLLYLWAETIDLLVEMVDAAYPGQSIE